MALINDLNITSQIAALANSGQVDTNQIVSILNSALPAGQQIANSTGGVTTGIFKRFGDFDQVKAKVEVVTTGLWSGDNGVLTTFYTASAQDDNWDSTIKSTQYYLNVYEYNPQISSSAEINFAVSYGHYHGSGSRDYSNQETLVATKGTYFQYKSMLLEYGETKFSFNNSTGTTTDSNDIFIINVDRGRFRESMDPGNWQLSLSGSNGLFHFIDDSGKKFSDTAGKAGRVFNIVSGSLNLGTEDAATVKIAYDTVSGEGFGKFYPDRGIIILNPKAVGSLVGNVKTTNGVLVGNLSGSASTAAEQYNHKRLFYAIRAGYDTGVDEGGFQARRTENISTQHFFVRATNREFNYSNNPTYVNTDGTFVETSFNTDPYTYVTTVGLYNDSNELVAVAKTSQPIPKSFDKEILIKVKLSF
jgi:fluoride ion exporter CrcB/FEX